MPELPEVETIRRDLHRCFAGHYIDAVEATGLRSVRRHSGPLEFVQRVRGRTLTDVGRRGKYLLLHLDDDQVVVVHLGMSGQLISADPAAPPGRHTHVRWRFAGAPELRFVDPRTFGEVFVTGGPSGEKGLPELAHLGVDPLADLARPADLGRLLAARGTKLKPLLMDQRFIAGIGNMYADEILFRARLRHDRAADGLTPGEVRRLHRAMTDILVAAIDHRGSSLADEQYRDLFGQVGGYQQLHDVYAREGQPCTRCRSVVVRVKAAGRSTYYCARCQT